MPGGTKRYVSIAELRAGLLVGTPAPSALIDVSDQGDVIARVFELDPPQPTGAGNPSVETIRNGTRPEVGSTSALAQFDSFHDGDQADLDWIGYRFDEPFELTRIEFQEGLHDATGGQFQALAVETRADEGADWVPVTNLVATPPYPGSANLADTYERFVVDFDPIVATEIRLSGAPTGSVGWISVGELRVFAFPEAEPCSAPPLTATYCDAQPNSTGVATDIALFGCESISTNAMGLFAGPTGPQQFGRFFYGLGQTQLPFGDGNICVNGTLYRFPAIPSNATGSATYSVDFTDPPAPAGQIQPGSTWNFQYWYRDPQGPGGTGLQLQQGADGDVHAVAPRPTSGVAPADIRNAPTVRDLQRRPVRGGLRAQPQRLVERPLPGHRTQRREQRSSTGAAPIPSSLADDLDQHALAAAAVELAVEDPFPGSEVELAARDGDDDLAAHDLTLEVGIAVVLAGQVVAVGRERFVRGELFEPALVVGVQARLVVVDEDAGGDVHGVDQAQALAHAALAHGGLDLTGDVDETAAGRDLEPELLAVAFHGAKSTARLRARASRSKVTKIPIRLTSVDTLR